MASIKLLILALALTWITGTESVIVSRVASKQRSQTQSNAVSCANLPNVVDKLLAAGLVSDGTPLISSNLYSVHYPAGSNPSATDLYSTIPENAFGPTDNKTGATSSAKGWDRTQVTADSGYGEQSDVVYAEDGGLPSFCRFGGQIQTSSSGSRALFEVWMPLPDNDSQDDDEVRVTFQDPAASSDHKLPPSRLKLAATMAQSSFATASASDWTKRLLFIVGGGLRGTVAYPELKQALARYRVAVAGTNMGHFSASSGTKWLPNNEEAWTDFGHRAVHLTTMASQLSVKTFYGTENLLENLDPQHRGPRASPGFYSYFRGCSTGGRAGMAEVQRYPKDFHGVMTGCPAFDYNNLGAYQIHVNSFQADKTSAAHIPTADYPLINKAVLESCDAQDGVKDGVVSLPHDCKPDFAKLIGCTALGLTPFDSTRTTEASVIIKRRAGQDVFETPANTSEGHVSATVASETSLDDDSDAESTSTSSDPSASSDGDTDGSSDEDDDTKKKPLAARCLLDPQLENLKNIYSDYYIDGKLIREAVLPGSEFGWTVTSGVTGKTFSAAPAWFQYQVLGQKTWDNRGFNAFTQVTPEVIALGQSKDPGGTIDFDTDLSGFFSNGGKLLHYHGLADQLVTSGVSSQYYEMVKAKMGGKDISDKYRLFFIPGMLHCRGGTGPFNFGGAGQATAAGTRPLQYDAQHDMFLALIDWVEKGKAPESIIGAAYKTDEGTGPTSSSQKTAFSHGVLNTRLLCPYPAQAKLKSGTKCTNAEACAFECI